MEIKPFSMAMMAAWVLSETSGARLHSLSAFWCGLGAFTRGP